MYAIKLGSRVIKQDSLPYVIAEIGVNHEGDLKKAMHLIDLAKEGGADAAKFQSYKAGKLASKFSPAYWDVSKENTLSQYQLFKKYDSFEPHDYEKLAKHCGLVGIDFLSTPFDDGALDFLDPLVPFFKIASADITNLPFLRKIALKGKPIVLSTGASTLAEIDFAVNTLENCGCSDVALLHCILNYPTDNSNASLRMIQGLNRAFPDKIIGYSDHTLPDESMTSLTVAYLLGAVIIEKHFTDNKKLPGNDHYHAMDVHDLKKFTNSVTLIKDLMGPTAYKNYIDTEKISRENARRSIVLARNCKKGEKITESNITYKRPGSGISPILWDDVIGGVLVKDLDQDHILQWSDFQRLNE